MKTCFSEGKLMKEFGTPPLSKRTPHFNYPPISEQFFHDPLLVQILKIRTSPLILGGRKLCCLKASANILTSLYQKSNFFSK